MTGICYVLKMAETLIIFIQILIISIQTFTLSKCLIAKIWVASPDDFSRLSSQ